MNVGTRVWIRETTGQDRLRNYEDFQKMQEDEEFQEWDETAQDLSAQRFRDLVMPPSFRLHLERYQTSREVLGYLEENRYLNPRDSPYAAQLEMTDAEFHLIKRHLKVYHLNEIISGLGVRRMTEEACKSSKWSPFFEHLLRVFAISKREPKWSDYGEGWPLRWAYMDEHEGVEEFGQLMRCVLMQSVFINREWVNMIRGHLELPHTLQFLGILVALLTFCRCASGAATAETVALPLAAFHKELHFKHTMHINTPLALETFSMHWRMGMSVFPFQRILDALDFELASDGVSTMRAANFIWKLPFQVVPHSSTLKGQDYLKEFQESPLSDYTKRRFADIMSDVGFSQLPDQVHGIFQFMQSVFRKQRPRAIVRLSRFPLVEPEVDGFTSTLMRPGWHGPDSAHRAILKHPLIFQRTILGMMFEFVCVCSWRSVEMVAVRYLCYACLLHAGRLPWFSHYELLKSQYLIWKDFA